MIPTMTCTTCGAAQPAGNKFCEDCGATLSPRPSVPAGDRCEVEVSPSLAGVSDRGTTKPRNEDRFAVAVRGDVAVLVVCDGVSCSQHPDAAAEAATAAVLQALGGESTDDRAGLLAALAGADAAVRAIPSDRTSPLDPPLTTAVVAVRRGDRVTVAWVGDSRAYLVDASGPRLLTRDHSWQHEAVDAGEMTAERAAADPQARSLTRTIGGGDEPSIAEVTVAAGQRLVLCTDGAWDGVTHDHWPSLACEGTALAAARRLVDRAKGGGTIDNITAAVLAI
jgi:serine/threonine protein phosphatase PrpC